MRVPGFFSAIVVLLFMLAAAAQPPQPLPPDLSPEVFRIASTLRCPVCQGESAAESNAGVSVEMRRIIAEKLAQGESEVQIQQYFVDRYGQWILYSPPKRGIAGLVWLSPLVALALIGLALWRYLQATHRREMEELLAEDPELGGYARDVTQPGNHEEDGN